MSTSEAPVRPFVPGRLAAGVERGTDGRAVAGRSEGFVTGYATGYSEGLRRAAAVVAAQEQQRRLVVEQELQRVRAQAGALLLSMRAAVVQLQEDSTVEAEELADLVAQCTAELATEVVLQAAPGAEALLGRIRRGLGDVPVGVPVQVQVSRDGLRVLERAAVLPDGLPDGVRVVVDDRLGDGDVVLRAGAATVHDLLRPAVAAAVAALREGDRP